MGTYNSFLFAGHGTSEKTGQYDSGAVFGNVKEADLTKKIVEAGMKYLKNTGLKIQIDEANFNDNDLAGNTYTSKCGLSVHINAGGGTGSEIYVPAKEDFLGTDFALVKGVSELLGIPNRGVKSRNYDTGATVTRKNGTSLNFTDYYGEIRVAWNQGISLSLLEVGFIDTSDLGKIQKNIDHIGYLCAKWIADNCDVTLPTYDSLNKPVTPPPTTTPSTKEIYYRVVVGSYKDKANAEKIKKEAIAKGFKDSFIVTFEK